MASDWGPLEALIGEWESDQGGLALRPQHVAQGRLSVTTP
jgi:hypothetical protein